LLFGGCEFQRQPHQETPGSDDQQIIVASEVEAMLLASSASWNGGDLDGFLDDYWRSEELTFSGATGITRGWDGVEARYRESYWAPGTARDSLRFEGIEVVPLGEEHALALGQYVLFRPEEGGIVTSSGYFSLVLKRVDADWKILHDHTSATPEDGGPSGEES
jgi:beta-aspartyl-peptidase (threonine type)